MLTKWGSNLSSDTCTVQVMLLLLGWLKLGLQSPTKPLRIRLVIITTLYHNCFWPISFTSPQLVGHGDLKGPNLGHNATSDIDW